MAECQNEAIRAIEAQQAKVEPRSPQWMVGEQLKDICRMEPKSAELIAQDLEKEAMSITEADGGMWKLKARQTVKAFLEEQLAEEVAGNGVYIAL